MPALASLLSVTFSQGFTVDRVNDVAEVQDQFAEVGFAGLQEEWQARHAWQDQPVVLLRDGQIENEGICRGADNDGALRVQTSHGIERCLSGDLSLRVNLS